MNLHLPEAEPRLQKRYRRIVASHLTPTQAVAAGLHSLPSTTQPFAAVQAAYRFLHNPLITLPQLAQPLIEAARQTVPEQCEQYLLTVLDWSPLHYGQHKLKKDRIALANKQDRGYFLLTALAISDRSGSPLAPLVLELEAADGVHTTRCDTPQRPVSALDNLLPVMNGVRELALGRTPLFIIDREADSVGHYRRWAAERHQFLVRADDQGHVQHEGEKRTLKKVAQRLRRQGLFQEVDEVDYHGLRARLSVAQSQVVLNRPARTHRVNRQGKAVHKNIAGPPLALRLVITELRTAEGRLLARWLLLTNLPQDVSAARIGVWYYWRWGIESYHKLLKGAGQHLEHWQQESAAALSRRLVIAAAAAVLVWQLARDRRPQAAQMRDLLVRVSGRQMKRGPEARGFTEPALMAGLMNLLPVLCLPPEYSLQDLRTLLQTLMPGLLPPSQEPSSPSG